MRTDISGEDPLLGMRMGFAVVSGIQSQGVVANAKHWVNNNQVRRQVIGANVRLLCVVAQFE